MRASASIARECAGAREDRGQWCTVDPLFDEPDRVVVVVIENVVRRHDVGVLELGQHRCLFAQKLGGVGTRDVLERYRTLQGGVESLPHRRGCRPRNDSQLLVEHAVSITAYRQGIDRFSKSRFTALEAPRVARPQRLRS